MCGICPLCSTEGHTRKRGNWYWMPNYHTLHKVNLFTQMKSSKAWLRFWNPKPFIKWKKYCHSLLSKFWPAFEWAVCYLNDDTKVSFRINWTNPVDVERPCKQRDSVFTQTERHTHAQEGREGEGEGGRRRERKRERERERTSKPGTLSWLGHRRLQNKMVLSIGSTFWSDWVETAWCSYRTLGKSFIPSEGHCHHLKEGT